MPSSVASSSIVPKKRRPYKPKPRITSSHRLVQTTKVVKKAKNAVWQLASQAPMNKNFTKSGKARARRNISIHTLRAWASGAALIYANKLRSDVIAYRIPDAADEKPRTPALPTISRSAAAIFDQYMSAFGSQIHKNARSLKDEISPSLSKPSPSIIKMAVDFLQEDLAATRRPELLIVAEKKRRMTSANNEDKEDNEADGADEVDEAAEAADEAAAERMLDKAEEKENDQGDEDDEAADADNADNDADGGDGAGPSPNYD